MTDLQLIHNNIKKYIRKYYLFRIIRGILLSTALLGLIFLFIIAIQYFYFLTVVTKQIIFYSFLVIVGAVLLEFIFIPIFKFLNILPAINNFKAASIISKKIPELKDVLINILELENIDSKNAELVQASINQKVKEIQVFNFSNSLKISELTTYLKYLIFPILLFLTLLFFNKSILLDGSQRFLNYTTYYEEKSPFNFILLNENLVIQSGTDLTIQLKIEGDYLPNLIFVNYGSNKIPMISNSLSKSVYEYTFKSINNNFSFNFEADGFDSKYFDVHVLPSPSVLDFTVEVNPPSYTSKSAFNVENTGDLVVPYGSKLFYDFTASDVDSLYLVFDSTYVKTLFENRRFTASYSAMKSSTYSVLVKNSFFAEHLFKYNLTVIPDLLPNIKVDVAQDSSKYMTFYYRGQIADDYGFKAVTFNYQVVSKQQNDLDYNKFNSITVDISKNELTQDFYYMYDFNNLSLTSDQEVKYYFKVTDNDIISGYKSVKTPIFSFYIPSLNELDSAFNAQNENVEQQLQDAAQLSFDIQNDIENFQQKMLNENVSQWEKENFLENLLKKQENLKNTIDSLKKDNQEKLNDLKAFDPKNEELLKKHEELQKLMDELFTDEMKQKLDELRKLQEKFDNKKFDKALDDNQMNAEDMSKEMDRSFELLKRMQLEQQLENTINQIDELANDQEKLAESFKENKDFTTEMQDSLLTNEFKFDELMNKYDSLKSQNKELEEPYKLEDFQDEINQIKQDFENAKEEMFDNKRNKSSEQMKKSSSDMKSLSDKMSSMMKQNSMEQNSEDMQTIKFLLSNLLSFSFAQEEINWITQKKFSSLSSAYNTLKISQLELTDEYNILSDSLYALASRNPMIGKMITDELNNIGKNLNKSDENLNLNKRNIASVSQRNTITSVNKLALMLQDALNSMQSQSSGSGSGNPQDGKSKKPGTSPGDMKSAQKSMQQQLQDMIDQMKAGKKPGGQQIGQQIGQREAFQKMLQQMMNGEGISDEMKELLQEISNINDEIKKDIINNNITPELLLKENEIQTRLLEVENSDNKRKFSNKRESKTGGDINITSPEEIEKIFKDYKLINESFSKKIIILNPFYKKYYNEYVYRLGQR